MIAELLAQLGSSSEEIAESLRKAGLKGKRANCWSCPISEYLKETTKQPMVRVLEREITIFMGEGEIVKQLVGPPTKCFVEDFDNGKYPDLEA